MMDAFQVLAPFLVAALAGAALAFLELLQTFQRNIGSALRSRWGVTLLAINSISAVLVYAFVRYGLGLNVGLWTALMVGVTFPLILRSRFTLYRQTGKKDEPGLTEFSLKLDEFYQTLQEWCYTEANALLAEELEARAAAIKKRFSPKELEDKLCNRIEAEPMSARRQEHNRRLQDILEKHKDDLKRRHHALALLLIDISSTRGLRELTL
jgi:hypothetical protein